MCWKGKQAGQFRLCEDALLAPVRRQCARGCGRVLLVVIDDGEFVDELRISAEPGQHLQVAGQR